MRFGSVCSGIEAASTAWHPLGWKTVYVSDIEPFPSAVLAARFGAGRPICRPAHIDEKTWEGGLRGVAWGNNSIPNFGDFTRITEDPPEIDLLVGGTPCQAFSVAGARESLADARGNLTLEFVRLVHATKSLRWAVWENVPGVLSTDDNAFGCFLGGLVGANAPVEVPGGGRWTDSGMVSGPFGRAAWRILDAQHFGLAQRRRRVFVVFCPSGTGGDPAAVLFERKSVSGHHSAGGEEGQGIAGGAGEGTGIRGVAPTIQARTRGGGGLGTDFECDGGVMPAVAFAIQGNMIGRDETAGPAGSGVSESVMFTLTKSDVHAVAFALRGREGGAQPEVEGDQAGALRAAPGGSSRSYVATGEPEEVMVVSEGQDNISESPVHGALTCGGGKVGQSYGAARIGSAVRRLTPTECERLQGFPDDHTLIEWRGRPAADGPRYKALGNSMAVPVMRWIGERIQAFEDGTLDTFKPSFTAARSHGRASAIVVNMEGDKGGASVTRDLSPTLGASSESHAVLSGEA